MFIMHPLNGPRLKIRRAESEIQALRRADESFMKDSEYHIVKAEFNPKTGKYVYRVRTSSEPPDPEWGVWIGEIAHNLRSALDSLVYQLALLGTKTPASNTQFPIFLVGKTTRKHMPHFEGMELRDGRSMIRQLLPKHQALIERLQPYKRSRGGRKNPLYWLKEVNNADKHRLIQVVGAKVGVGPVVGGWVDTVKYPFDISHPSILKDGAKIGEAPTDMGVGPKVFPLVAFWKGCEAVKGLGVCYTLRRIAEHIAEIVESFGPEFLPA